MTLKILIITLMISVSSKVFSAGGVDVGNGLTTSSLIETNSFNSEESLVEFGEVLLNSINYGLDPIAVSIASAGECDLNRFKFNSMDIKSFYPPVKKESFSMKKFRAKILIDFFNCKNPIAIDYSNDSINGEK